MKVSLLLAEITIFQEMNEAYLKFFPDELPAGTAVGAVQVAARAMVEVDCIA